MFRPPRALSTLAVGVGLALAGATASAAVLTYSLAVTDAGNNSFAGNGSISINTALTGEAAVNSFAFTITAFDGLTLSETVSFGAGNIDDFSYAIGAAPNYLLSLDLTTNPITVGGRRYSVGFDTLGNGFTAEAECRSEFEANTSAAACSSQSSSQQMNRSSTLVASYQAPTTPPPNGAVPVPGTVLLLGAGLLGLGAIRRSITSRA
jgi:hypothetical protein